MTRMAAELERRWLTRYLDRELSNEDRDWFETYLLDKPDLLIYLEADTALGEGLRALAAQGELAAVERVGGSRKRHWTLFAAATAGLLVGVASTLLIATDNGERPEASPASLQFQVSRGDSAGVRSDPGNPAAKLAVITIALPPLATLESVQWHHGGTIAALPGARIDQEGQLLLLLPRAQVEGSELTLELTDEGQQYQRRIRLKAPAS